MTFRIANNQIHIGWPETISIIVAIVGGVWGVRAGYDDWIQERQRTNITLIAIQRELSIKQTTDSIQTAGIGELRKEISQKFDSLGNALIDHQVALLKSKSKGPRFYTEKWVNGHLQITEVNQN